MSDYDVIVIGAGTSGQTVAEDCAKGGLRVAVVDRREYGGTCARRGCIPKKVLVAASEAVGRVEGMAGHGITGEVAIDWPALIAWKRTFTDPVPEGIEAWFTDLDVAQLHGTARFLGERELDIDGERVSAERIVVATGSRPRRLGIPGEELVIDSEAFMELDDLPRRVLFVGGGYVSFEFAGLARRAGAEVTIVHRSETLLSGFDPQLAGMLVERYRGLGIEIETGLPVVAVERAGGAFVVRAGDHAFETDLVVHGAGRVPDIADLDLEAGGVTFGPRGVEVDERLRSTSNPHVSAVGDAAALGLPLTPVGVAEGRIAAADILGGDVAFDAAVTPSVVYSDPPLAKVGVDAGRKDLSERFFDTSGWFAQRRVGQTHAGVRILTDRETDVVFGAHLLGPDAEEVVNVFALAIRKGATLEELRRTLWSYPTSASDIVYYE